MGGFTCGFRRMPAVIALALAFACTLACFMAVLAAPVRAHAEAGLQSGAATREIVVKDANGDVLKTYALESDDITSALAKALRRGKSGDGCQQTTVYVPAGDFTIGTSRRQRIYSNTKLVLDENATITMTGSEGPLERSFLMLTACHFDEEGNICGDSECKHGGHSQFTNITVTGGTWNADCDVHPRHNITIFMMKHGRNIVIDDVILTNFTNHAINLAGSKDVTVKNCAFLEAVAYDGDNERFWGGKKPTGEKRLNRIRSTEAIHTDFCAAGCEKTAYPKDGTPCENITVTDCVFEDIYSGVGTHHENSFPMRNIVVRKCRFVMKDGYAVNLFSCAGAKVSDNVVEFGLGMVRASKATVTVQSNKALECEGRTVSCLENSKVTVKTNAMKSLIGVGIRVEGGSKATIAGNTIEGSDRLPCVSVEKGGISASNNKLTGGFYGISVESPASSCIVKSNRISGAVHDAVKVTSAGSRAIAVSGNTVSGPLGAGIAVTGGKTTVSDNTVSGSRNAGISVSGGTSKVSGNKVSASRSSGISVTGGTATVSGNTVSSPRSSGIAVSGGTATVSGNVVSAAQGACVDVSGGKATVSSNKLTGGSGGIALKNPSGVCTVKSNQVSSAKGDAIRISSAGNFKMRLSANVVSRVQGAGITVSGGRPTVSGNQVSDTKGEGIALAGCVSTVSGNSVAGARKECVAVSGGKATVSENKLTGGSAGISLVGPTGACTVKSNKLTSQKGDAVTVSQSQKRKVKVVGNTASKVKRSGVRLLGCKNVLVQKNKTLKCKYSLRISSSAKVNAKGNKLSASSAVVRVESASTGVKLTKNTLKKTKRSAALARIGKDCQVKWSKNKVKGPGAKAAWKRLKRSGVLS